MQHQVITRAMQHLRVWELTWWEIGNVLNRIVIFIAGGQDEDVYLQGMLIR